MHTIMYYIQYTIHYTILIYNILNILHIILKVYTNTEVYCVFILVYLMSSTFILVYLISST